MNDSTNLWGGRFSGPTEDSVAALSRSIHFDWRLAKYDIAATRAHILALKAAGFITEPELVRIDKALVELDKRVAGAMFTPKPTDSDVHSALDRGLIEMVGPDLGGKVKAGRARNDHASLVIRYYLIDQAEVLRNQVLDLIDVLTTLAQEHLSEPMPGRTHFQHAQPVLLSHHLLAHVWPLVRDLERLGEWRKRAAFSPYGAGDIAGTSLALDPAVVSEALGLGAPLPNSIDATSSRDVVAEFAFIGTLISINLSRFAEELIIWSTAEFDYVKLADAFSTEASLVSQKNNPDLAELTRAKAGRAIGNLAGLLATLKSLPLAYSRDLQEDKEPVFDILDSLGLVLPAFTGMVATAKFNTERMEELATAGYSLATDVTEWLIRKKVPFKEAQEITGKLVTFAKAKALELDELSDGELTAISSMLTPDVREVLSVSGSIKSRTGIGGTSVPRVLDQISALRKLVPAGSR